MCNSNSEMSKSVITNREALKEKIHDIHNYLRNHGAGYGMNALKVFNIIYGLKKIDEADLLEKTGLDDCCKFSNLLDLANGDKGEELTELILKGIMKNIFHSKIKDFLFYDIPRNIKADTFVYLIKEIENITKVEQSSGVQLCGKIYEYFIGRDQTAISELGAYFTDRHIVNYIYNLLESDKFVNKGIVSTMIDPFGGSGGFTVGYINHIIRKNIANSDNQNVAVDWSTEISKISHFDINEDVIPSCPIAIPSVTVIVQNSLGVPPEDFTPFLTDCACLISAILQGAASFHVETTPTKGFATSFSVKFIA